MYWLTWGTSDRADWKAFGNLLCITVVAFRFTLYLSIEYLHAALGSTYLSDDLYLPVEASCSALYQGHIRGQTHLVDMSSCIEIIQRIEHQIKALKPFYIETGVLNVRVMRFELDLRIEFRGGIFGDLVE